MFFEARTHKLRPVKDCAAAAALIHKGNIHSYEVPTFSVDGTHYYFVNDAHTDDGSMFGEVAVLKSTDGEHFIKIESITAAWIDSASKLTKYFEDAIAGDENYGTPHLIIGNPTGEERAWFECGCCGTGFKDNVKKQIAYDQDAGYGICDDCSSYY